MNYSPDLIENLLKVLTALGTVLVVMMVLFYFAKQFLGRTRYLSGNSIIRVLASNYVGVKKQISLVQIPGSILVLGLSGDRIQLLTKIENEEIVKSMTPAEEKASMPLFHGKINQFLSKLKVSRNNDNF
jgi:flagellar protein FliO/FliZ